VRYGLYSEDVYSISKKRGVAGYITAGGGTWFRA
jgi:hypothetical protein